MAEKMWRVLVINPGSTSTKVGVFEGDEAVFTVNVAHEASDLAKFEGVSDQLPYRVGLIEAALADNGVELGSIDAFVGRGGGLLPMPGGTYAVNDVMLDHATRGANGVQHPAQLGPQIAHAFAALTGKPAFVVNPPDTDELCDDARMTGIRGVYRHVHLHALNLKETAIRHAASMGRAYEDCRFVVCHIGGGISISAHDHGKMVDGYDIVGGEGMMAPTRCGGLPVAEVLDYLEAGHTTSEARKMCMKTGGFVDLLGTSAALEVSNRAADGDEAASRAWSAMQYQICRCIGGMAAVLGGQVDGILLGGGMIHNKGLVKAIEERCGWIAPVSAYPGEFELEAMAAGACRVLSGDEEAGTYTGVPVFTGFACFDEA
ncbi:butyrate kinase [Paratractidigestivibacter sp.]|uniref:butyrate kinase n=1 Tax=Paratractidigestivibacter sp. TaxID=2847316 RepID=UPI002ACB0E93|nr:butyrate kinase [Paratractidigestivibacter sp.]